MLSVLQGRRQVRLSPLPAGTVIPPKTAGEKELDCEENGSGDVFRDSWTLEMEQLPAGFQGTGYELQKNFSNLLPSTWPQAMCLKLQPSAISQDMRQHNLIFPGIKLIQGDTESLLWAYHQQARWHFRLLPFNRQIPTEGSFCLAGAHREYPTVPLLFPVDEQRLDEILPWSRWLDGKPRILKDMESLGDRSIRILPLTGPIGTSGGTPVIDLPSYLASPTCDLPGRYQLLQLLDHAVLPPSWHDFDEIIFAGTTAELVGSNSRIAGGFSLVRRGGSWFPVFGAVCSRLTATIPRLALATFS